MNALFIVAFIVMPVVIVAGAYALVRFTEHKYGIDPRAGEPIPARISRKR